TSNNDTSGAGGITAGGAGWRWHADLRKAARLDNTGLHNHHLHSPDKANLRLADACALLYYNCYCFVIVIIITACYCCIDTAACTAAGGKEGCGRHEGSEKIPCGGGDGEGTPFRYAKVCAEVEGE